MKIEMLRIIFWYEFEPNDVSCMIARNINQR